MAQLETTLSHLERPKLPNRFPQIGEYRCDPLRFFAKCSAGWEGGDGGEAGGRVFRGFGEGMREYQFILEIAIFIMNKNKCD